MQQHQQGSPPETAFLPADPDTGAAAEASTAHDVANGPMAVIVITVQRDRIHQTARLVMGGTRAVTRRWDRNGRGSWQSRDPDWSEQEERIGLELAEYMDALALPDRVADLLPRPPSAAGAAAAAKAAEEVRNG